MNKKKLASFFLSVLLLCALLLQGTPVFAVDDPGEDSGMVISKTATPNPDGSYTVRLEAYAEGSAVISHISEDVPTDIVLVLDQSGSMTDPLGSFVFNPYTGNNRRNSYLYARRHNGGSENLWYELPDGGYASVSVRLDGSYTAINNQTNSYYYNNRNNLYHKVGDEYVQVNVSRTGMFGAWRNYSYTSSAGLNVTSSGDNTVPNFGSSGPLYLLGGNADQYVYTYLYMDGNDQLQTIGSSTGENTVFADEMLYERSIDNSTSRLQALRAALNTFVSQVNQKAAGADGEFGTADDVNHRVAVVGFASGGTNNQNYGNTEVFIGSQQYRYGTAAQGVYDRAFQSMDTSAGRSNVTASIGALDAQGATRADLGMEMARGILQANPVPAGEQRNRIVIMFTDGSPTSSNGFEMAVANAAITNANTIKNDYGATVYAVGVFAGADATSAGSSSGDVTQQSNWFMQNLSSNNGTVQSPGYYLSAADAGTLTRIFEQIASQIETGGTTSTLNEHAVIRDGIAPAFTLPTGMGADAVAVETYACTGVNAQDEYTWSKNSSSLGATVAVSSSDSSDPTTTNDQISVTGFNFAENYVGTVTDDGNVTYRGNKLVILITLRPREGFIGGNGVQTNTTAGIYEDENATEPILVFDQPTVDVQLADMSVQVESDERYLGSYYGQNIAEDSIKLGANVVIAGSTLDFEAENYGLAPWQNEYVNINVSSQTQGNNASLENVVEDITYTVTIAVTPKNPGTIHSDGASDTGSGSVHVFTPKLTYKDSNAFFGEEAVYGDSTNLVARTWIHRGDNKDHQDADVLMLNAEPKLTIAYAPESGAIVDGKVASKQDIPVSVAVTMGTVSLNSLTVFEHQACSPDCGWQPSNTPGVPAFQLHVATGSLTIEKRGGKAGVPYVFTILRDGNAFSEATIVGNGSVTLYELPAGVYTIREDSGWTWRYDPSVDGRAAIGGTSPTGNIVCTNSANNNVYWLNGYSELVENTVARLK